MQCKGYERFSTGWATVSGDEECINSINSAIVKIFERYVCEIISPIAISVKKPSMLLGVLICQGIRLRDFGRALVMPVEEKKLASSMIMQR